MRNSVCIIMYKSSLKRINQILGGEGENKNTYKAGG